MPISKLEAAQRQLDIAIELYLYEQDLLPVHTLAWAAFSILVSYDEATNAGGVWAKHIRDNPSSDTRKLANFLKHADRDPLAQLDELSDEYTHHLLLEGCKLYYELTHGHTRPTDVSTAMTSLWTVTPKTGSLIGKIEMVERLLLPRKLRRKNKHTSYRRRDCLVSRGSTSTSPKQPGAVALLEMIPLTATFRQLQNRK